MDENDASGICPSTLSPLQNAALEWGLERMRVEQCMRNQAHKKVGLAEKLPQQFRMTLKMAILSSPNALQVVDEFVSRFQEYLDNRYAIQAIDKTRSH